MKTAVKKRDQDVRSKIFRAELTLWRAKKLMRHRLIARQDQVTVFVTGSQRSGTNMLMECMDWSAKTDVYHESDLRAFDKRYVMLPRSVIHALVRASRSPFFVIKSLCEGDEIKSLMDEFSPAKSIWIVRDFRDSVNSMIRNFPDFVITAREIAEDPATFNSWQGRGMSEETLALVRQHYNPEMSEASAAALQWYFRNILFFEQDLDADRRVMLIRYSDLVSQPMKMLEKVFSFLEIDGFSPFITRKVHSRSVRKNPEPPIDSDIRALCLSLMERFDTVAASPA